MVGFPLLLIPLAICNIIVFLMPGLSFSAPLVTVPLTSGIGWPVTLSDVLLTLGILMLLFEVIKGARPGAKYLTDHLLSLVVFGAAAAEFLLLPLFGTSTYFLLTMLALVDFLSGVALRTRRHPVVAAVAVPSVSSPANLQPRQEPRPSEPQIEPKSVPAHAPEVTAPSLPPAEPVIEPAAQHAEPVPQHAEAVPEHAEPVPEHAEPVPQHAEPVPEPIEPKAEPPEVAAQEPLQESPPEHQALPEPVKQPVHEPSPEIQSPGLQPGSGLHSSPDAPSR
jgi:hypothetical protein